MKQKKLSKKDSDLPAWNGTCLENETWVSLYVGRASDALAQEFDACERVILLRSQIPVIEHALSFHRGALRKFKGKKISGVEFDIVDQSSFRLANLYRELSLFDGDSAKLVKSRIGFLARFVKMDLETRLFLARVKLCGATNVLSGKPKLRAAARSLGIKAKLI